MAIFKKNAPAATETDDSLDRLIDDLLANPVLDAHMRGIVESVRGNGTVTLSPEASFAIRVAHKNIAPDETIDNFVLTILNHFMESAAQWATLQEAAQGQP